jgi:hypothetical protein
MATQRDRFRAFNDEDGAMSLDDLLMQIQQPQIDTEAIARQQAEAQRQAQIAAEQRAYEEQARQAQIRQEEIRVQNAARLAAEQEAAMQAQAEQQARAQAEAQRQTAQAPITTQEVINQIAAQPAQPDKNTIINNLVGQIKARSNTSQWSGGYGADDATKDMARILAETGITDISQFGPVTQEVQKIVGYEDWGAPIYQTVTEQTYGNKVTGQAVPNTYTTRQTGEFFGGTYEGKGNTGYGVQFDAQGQPIFYTQGASSADPIAKAAVPIASLALAAIGAPTMLGNTLLGAGANQVAAGALGGALIGGGTAALTDQDVGKGALLGGAGGALSGYLSGSPTGLTDRGLAIADAKQLAASGIPTSQISEILTTSGYPAAIVNRAIDAISPTVASIAPVAANNLVITAPSVAPSTIGNVISTIAQQPTITPPVTEPVVTPVIEPTPLTGTITNPPLQNLQISTPAVTPNITDVISAIALQPTPVAQPVVTSVVEPPPTSVEITTQRPTQQIDPNVLNAVNTALQTNVTKPIETVQITGQSEKPKETPAIANVISTIATPSASTTLPPELVITGQTEKPTVKQTETQPTIPLIMSPTAPTSVPPEPVKPQPEKDKEKSWTAAQLADLARLGLLATTVLGAGQTGETGFPIVPIPSNWTSPIKPTGSTGVAPTQLPPIDFGSRELLRGTQWEKFLDPNYGQVPAPVQFNQPNNMSYDRLMSILGTGKDVMPSQALTINDVISGIQNQYGQTTNSAMGQKPT